MGIDVGPDRRVSYSPAHHNRVVSDPARNPVVQMVGDLTVVGIFRRTKTGDREHDGNPLIYALKGKNGYRLTYGAARRLLADARQIIPQIAAVGSCDVIVPMPSSSNVARYVARELGRAYALAPEERFRKATVGEALAWMLPPEQVAPALRRAYTAQLRTMQHLPTGSLVQMKEVRESVIRPLVPAVTADVLTDLAGKRIMLVDDLLSTGSTLRSAKALLEAAGAAGVFGVCLLSSTAAVRTDLVAALTGHVTHPIVGA